MSYSLSHLADGTLLRNLAALVARDRTTNAMLLAHVAEVDARRLYLPAACPSMHVYCVRELHMSDDVAYKRIHAARAAREFPVILEFVADGRLHLSAVAMLAPKLTSETVHELLAAATHKTKAEIEQLLAQRFPQPDVPTRIQAIPSRPTPPSLTPQPVLLEPHQPPTETLENSSTLIASRSPLLHDVQESKTELAPGRVETFTSRPKTTPLSAQRFSLQVTIPKSTHDKLRLAQELLSHQLPSGDIAEVLDRALDALIHNLQKRKFAATTRPRTSHRSSAANTRHIPAHVRRAVWERDGGQCTFVSEDGHRCPTRKFLEFDHIDEVARGGKATVARVRLRCRAHNQYEAERTFGTEFMNAKRRQVHSAAAESRATAAAGASLARPTAAPRPSVSPPAHRRAAGRDTRPRAVLAPRHPVGPIP